MSTQLFGQPNVGGSFADKLAQAREFLNGARGTAAPAADAAVDPVTHGLAAEAPAVDVAPGAAAPTGIDAAAPVTTAAGHDPDGLAAAARAAAEQSIADPAYAAAATQQVEVVVQPRVMVQGQSGPIVVPVDIAVPAAQTNVTVAPAQAVVLDASGQAVAAPVAAAAAPVADVAAPPTRGFRSWGIEELASLGRGRGATPAVAPSSGTSATTAGAVAAEAPAAAAGGGWRSQVEHLLLQGRGGAGAAADAPAAAVVADAPVVAAAGGGGWRAKVEDALGLAKAGGATEATVAEHVAAEAPKVGLLDRIRTNTAGIGELLTRSGSGGVAAAAEAVAPVADDVAKAMRPGIGAELRAAVELAKTVR